jgi:polar amino acid transport system substrate-binding protein
MLKIGVSLGEPFAMTTHGDYFGIAIDIWSQLADELNLKYTYVLMSEHIDEAIEKLAAGQIDVFIGPIVPTYKRIKLVEFSQPYYLNQIGLVVPVKHVIFLNVLRSIFDSVILSGLVILLAVFLLYLHVYWYYELRPFHKTYRNYMKGISEAFWLHTLDIDLGKIPSHFRTRVMRFLWLILVTIFFSSITAAITSALTIALTHHYTYYSGIDELKNKPVAAVVNTAPYEIARNTGFTDILTVNSRDEAVKLLLQRKVAAYVDYYPVADYYINLHDLSRTLTTASNLVIQRNTFAFAVPINSPLLHALNVKLILFKENELTKPICKKYFQKNSRAVLNCEV